MDNVLCRKRGKMGSSDVSETQLSLDFSTLLCHVYACTDLLRLSEKSVRNEGDSSVC